MIIIYDFDGTLTPYGIPKYEILKKCGYDTDKLLELISEIMKDTNKTLYESFYEAYEMILKDNNIVMSIENITLGANNVLFNKGVLDYFENFQTKKTGILHFIVTSGFRDYVLNTKIAKFVYGIYGVTYKISDGLYKELENLVSDEVKPSIIKEILQDKVYNMVIYIGDGLTDRNAFKYVHSIGGKCLYVGASSKDFENYNKLKEDGIVDEYFEKDFSKDSQLRKYIKKQI